MGGADGDGPARLLILTRRSGAEQAGSESGAISGRDQVDLNLLRLAAAVTGHHHGVDIIFATMRDAPVVPMIR